MRKVILALLLSFIVLVCEAQSISVQLVHDVGTLVDGEMRVCQGLDVLYTAIVDYGNTDGADETTFFTWSVAGNEYEGSLGENTWSVSYDYAAGSHVQVSVIEELSGETANNSVLVTVAGAPSLESLILENFGAMYLGQTPEITASITAGDPGYIGPFTGSIVSSGIEQTITFLPDGSGVSYESSIVIQGAPLGTLIDDNNTIGALWASLEHSYLGDLDVSLICPDGTEIEIVNQGGGSCNLGTPWSTAQVDGESANSTQGDGTLYYWSETG